MKILILEDDENRIEQFKHRMVGEDLWITKDPHEANKWLEENVFDLIFLDHDLSDEHYITDPDNCENTGRVTADFIGGNVHLCPNASIYVHSLNGYGSMLMALSMKNRGYKVQIIPFTKLITLIHKI